MTASTFAFSNQARSWGLLLSATLCSLAAWGQDAPQDGVYKDRIDWGVLMDMSGPTSASQGIWVHGFRDHMRKINEAGGINGRKINVLAEDNRFNPATDKIAFEKLVSQTPVIAISGMGTSVSQVALAPTIKAGKVPIVGTYTATKALSEPVSPMVYNGFCGYKQMAQAGVGYHVDKLKLKSAKVVTLAIETAGGKEYHDYVAEAVGKLGGTSSLVTMKITSVDVTPQIQEIIKQKPDFITIYGVPNTAILTMKGMQQYGLKVPAFGISYLLSPQIYASIGAEAGANYNVISCFTPGGADQSAGNREVMAAADKYNHSGQKEDINYVAGWAVGQMVAQAVQLAGPEPTRSKIVAAMSKGFTVDTKGLTAPIVFSPTNQSGPSSFRMIGYDYNAKRYTAFGEFRDYDKFMK